MKDDNARMQSDRSKRMTLNKQIASAPTLAKKWEIALHGGQPPTAIQRLPMEAFGVEAGSTFGEEWRKAATDSVKQKFVEQLFPALLRNDTGPFEQLIQAMRDFRKSNVSLEEFARRNERSRKAKPTKKEMGRRLRLALLTLDPDDRLNIQTVRAALGKIEGRFSEYHGFDCYLATDDSKIYAVMKELGLRFLRPGDAARWIHGGQIVRTLQIQANGELKCSGMTRDQISALTSCNCQMNF